MAVGNVFGYDAYMIQADTLRNVADGKRIVGFAIDLRIANYRGYILSQIEDIRLTVDGMTMPRDSLTLTVNGRSYALEALEAEVDNRWGILDVATLTCMRDGGLAPGSHEVSVEEHIRASYIPMVAVAVASRMASMS